MVPAWPARAPDRSRAPPVARKPVEQAEREAASLAQAARARAEPAVTYPPRALAGSGRERQEPGACREAAAKASADREERARAELEGAQAERLASAVAEIRAAEAERAACRESTRARVVAEPDRQAVQLTPLPAIMKPANDLTIAAWYQATTVDVAGSEIASAGDQYLLRVNTADMLFAKATSATTYVNCNGAVANPIDGAWHHVAGVTTASGTVAYFDGVPVCTSAGGANISYAIANEFWVGRHGSGKLGFDFGGNIDEVRVYARALSAVEIASLAQGNN